MSYGFQIALEGRTVTSPADRVNARIATRGTIRSAWISALCAIIAAPLAGAGAYAGAVGAARQNADAAERAEVRAQRTQMYRDFLDAANEVKNQAVVVDGAFASTQSQKGGTDETLDARRERFQAATATYSDRYRELRRALDDIYVFGSDEATGDAQALFETLPPNVSRELLPPPRGGLMERSPGEDGTAWSIAGYGGLWSPDEFDARYIDFLDTFCQEAPAKPRASCTS